MKFDGPVQQGTLVRRYKRFLADVEVAGEVLTVHCANSGSMMGCTTPGSPVLISDSQNPKRKLRHTLEAIQVGRTWVGVNTARPNRVVKRFLEEKKIPAFEAYDRIRPEYKLNKGTRLDFLLEGEGLPPYYLEVKNVTLIDGAVAMFPDSVTERGAKHMRELGALAAEGHKAGVLFFIHRADCDRFFPAHHIDPKYAEALRKAHADGVEITAVRVRVSKAGVTFDGILPYELAAN